jgi:7tm Chemosensory receptor
MKGKLLKGNSTNINEKELYRSAVALKPLILFLNVLGLHPKVEKEKNKICALIHSTSFLIVLLLSGIFAAPYLENNIDYYNEKGEKEEEGRRSAGSVVVMTISYINFTCIYLTLIMISLKSVFAGSSERKRLWRIFKCFDNIDAVLQTSFSIKCNEESRMFVIVILLLLFLISASAALIVDSQRFNLNKKFTAGRCIYGTLVYVLGVEISFYCMLVRCIEARFRPLCKYLLGENKTKENDDDVSGGGGSGKKSSHVEIESTTKLIVTVNARQVSRVEEISLIYDEMLEIISLLNDSFSTLLSSAFSKY